MVSHCTLALLVLESQRDEESRGGRRRRHGLAKQPLTWLRLQAVNFLKVMVCVCLCVSSTLVSVRVSTCQCLFPFGSVLYVSKRFC